MKIISSSELDRKPLFKKGYMKIFILAVLLLILGILLISVTALVITFADPDTPAEYEVFYRTMNTLSTISILSIQIGIVFFSLSTFVGALVDKTLSGEVRRGMVLVSGFGILALGIMMITVMIFI
ncbi:MAG: hypothetical protein ACFFHD_16395 [Promethearchaeota archaeon]